MVVAAEESARIDQARAARSGEPIWGKLQEADPKTDQDRQ